MAILIKHNMSMLNTNRQLNISTARKAKSAEKLSSGYRINRAADDAAGLAISEKMRRMVRGLKQGTENAQDGVSWVQIGDGSLEETHAMLHRMTQLAVQASNETNTDQDRALMEVEFDHLQKEIDRLTDNTYFNEKHIFKEHEWPYYQFEGVTQWPQEKMHTVRAGENDLVVTYRQQEEDLPKTASVTVPLGAYTTRELMDEIDTALRDAGLTDEGIVFEYSQIGTCNLNLEGGEKIDDVSGGLSYLLFDKYNGGTLGSLIGTTKYTDDTTKRFYVEDLANDFMTFQVYSAENTETPLFDVQIDLDTGVYSKQDLIDRINAQLKDKLAEKQLPEDLIKAEPYGSSIKVSSTEFIISEFKGNMFEIDGGLHSSVFYDNIKQAGNILRTSAEFQGGYVLRDPNYTIDPNYPQGIDPEGSVFHFKAGENNLLVLKPNGKDEFTVDLTHISGTGTSWDGQSLDGKNVREVCSALQDIFDAHDAGLIVQATATRRYERLPHNGSYGYTQYMGIAITSQEKGPESAVGINRAKSTAYTTLFTSNGATVYGEVARFGGNDGTPDSNARVVGLRDLSGGITIRQGQNDSFRVQLAPDRAVTITLDSTSPTKTYNNAQDVADEIQAKLKDAGYDRDQIIVSASGGKIRLEAQKTEITGISLDAVPGNEGYRDIFQSEVWQGNGSQVASKITLPEKVVKPDGSVSIQPPYNILKVRVDGEWRQVDVQGNWATKEDLEKHITDSLPPTEKRVEFNKIVVNGGSPTQTTTSASAVPGRPRTNARAADYTGLGHTQGGEGEDGDYLVNDPAAVTFKTALQDTITITDKNKNFNFSLNGGSLQTMDLSQELGQTTFASRDEFKNKLQEALNRKLNVASGDLYGGIQVDFASDGATLILKAGLKNPAGGVMPGQTTQITLEVNKEGGFIYDLHDASDPATATLSAGRALNTGFSVGQSSLLELTLTTPSGTTPISLDLSGGPYNSYRDIEDRLNGQLSGKGITVKASGSGLTFTTDGKGSGYAVSVNKDSDAVKYLFGYKQTDGSYELFKNHPATATTNKAIQGEITFTGEQTFDIIIDNNTYHPKIQAGTYNRAQMAAEIERAITAEAGGNKIVSVTAPSGLSFTTVSENGTNSTIELEYQPGSALETIFGKGTGAGVKAKFNDQGQLTLERVPYDPQKDPFGTLYVTSNLSDGATKGSGHQGGSFIMPTPKYGDPEPYDGHHSGQHSFMQGVDLTERINSQGKVTINQYNSKLSFYCTDSYNVTNNTAAAREHIEVTMPEGEYSVDKLMGDLQTAIDNQIGKNKLEVKWEENGIRIQAVNSGSKYRIFTRTDTPTSLRPSGGFYEKILCGNRQSQAIERIQKDHDGEQLGGRVYAMGRQDVKNKTVKIQKDGNDTLSLEFTTPTHEGNNAYKLKMKLEPGYYNSDQLVEQIQKQLDQALRDNGLPAGLIEAVVGYDDPETHITGAIDDRALAFVLSKKVSVSDGDGKYGIEAIGGTAAFSVFYATEGDIARAYIKGGQDISQGVTIEEGATDFSVDVDGKTYTINLTPGTYSAEDLAAHMTKLFKAVDDPGPCPLQAIVDEGKLKLMHTKYGQYKISNLRGAIKNQLFFTERGEKATEDLIHLRLSSASGDWKEIERPWMNTMSLGINSLTISKVKYAQKAIGRIKEAVTKVSDVRSYFGAKQNQLESTIRNNENKTENTSAAESRIRDADISREAVENSIHSILEQAGVSVLAQAKQNAQLALQILS